MGVRRRGGGRRAELLAVAEVCPVGVPLAHGRGVGKHSLLGMDPECRAGEKSAGAGRALLTGQLARSTTVECFGKGARTQ